MEIKKLNSLEKNQKDINNISEENNAQSSGKPEKISLGKFGFDDWFNSKSNEILNGNLSLARITQVNKNNYKVHNGQHEIVAELSGNFLFSADSSLDYPTIGDWVGIQSFDEDSLAIIHHVLPRKSLMKRKDPGKAVEFQLIAANIDYAFILQSLNSNFNMNRLERYIVMANESRIEPIVILTKTDLISAEALTEIYEQLNRLNDKYLILPISSVTDDGIEALKEELQSNKTYCLLGSSGVGKTTLLNKLLGQHRFDVNDVRKSDSKGKHTTVRRQLIRLESGSIFIDTPGMRELGNFAIESGLDETFDDIVTFGKQCRFKDCTHIHETGCAVKEAVEQGVIDNDRYANYLQIQKESAYYQMSYLEKRSKDRSFGKMLKNYKKTIRKK